MDTFVYEDSDVNPPVRRTHVLAENGHKCACGANGISCGRVRVDSFECADNSHCVTAALNCGNDKAIDAKSLELEEASYLEMIHCYL
jgi:hypothetical protein